MPGNKEYSHAHIHCGGYATKWRWWTKKKKKKVFAYMWEKNKQYKRFFVFFNWANICVVMGPTSWIYTLFGFSLFSSWYLSCTTWSLKDFLFHWASLGALSTDGSVRSQAATWHWTLEFGWLTLVFCTVEAELWSRFPIKRKKSVFCCGSAVVACR